MKPPIPPRPTIIHAGFPCPLRAQILSGQITFPGSWSLPLSPQYATQPTAQPVTRETLELIFSRPTPTGVKWNDAAALLTELGAEITEQIGRASCRERGCQ